MTTSRPRKIAKGAFLLGAVVATVLGLPLLCVSLLALQAVGIGERGTGLDRLIVHALVFAGLPAFLTGGGVARLAAHRGVEAAGGAPPSLRRIVRVAAVAMAAAGIGLAILIAVPIGGLPERHLLWIWLAVAGVLAGAATGAAIGVLVAFRQRRAALEPPAPPAPAADVTVEAPT